MISFNVVLLVTSLLIFNRILLLIIINVYTYLHITHRKCVSLCPLSIPPPSPHTYSHHLHHLPSQTEEPQVAMTTSNHALQLPSQFHPSIPQFMIHPSTNPYVETPTAKHPCMTSYDLSLRDSGQGYSSEAVGQELEQVGSENSNHNNNETDESETNIENVDVVKDPHV